MGVATIRVWDEDECRRVHEATLRVLAEAGVEVLYEPAVEYLVAAGARVDGSRVRLDRRLVDDALGSAPRSWPVRSRGRAEVVTLADGQIYFGTGSDCLYVADPDTGRRRRATLDDVEGLSALCEVLPNIDFVMSMGFPAGLPPELEVLHQHVAMLRRTRKPLLITPRDGAQLARMKGMAELCGEEESLMVYGMPSPPLIHDRFALTKIIESARLRMPLVYAPAPTAATTAPASVAAVVVVGNAEVISGLVLHQLVSPGAPFVYGAGCDTFDMHTMINPYVSPEWLLGCQAGCDLAHFYGLPSFSYAAYSDAKSLDEQWTAEAGLTSAVGALSRGTLLHDVGYLESGMQTAYEAVVLGDELVGFARHLLREVAVDDEALAVDEILAVGPGGNHLGRRYTRAHYREFWTPSLLDRAAHDRWQAAGATSLKERVRAKVAELRAAPPAFELGEDASARLDEMLAAAATGAAA